MTVNTKLADAARWYAFKAARIPEQHRPDAAIAWGELTGAVESAGTPRAALRAIEDWRERVEIAFAHRLLNSPLPIHPTNEGDHR